MTEEQDENIKTQISFLVPAIYRLIIFTEVKLKH